MKNNFSQCSCSELAGLLNVHVRAGVLARGRAPIRVTEKLIWVAGWNDSADQWRALEIGCSLEGEGPPQCRQIHFYLGTAGCVCVSVRVSACERVHVVH